MISLAPVLRTFGQSGGGGKSIAGGIWTTNSIYTHKNLFYFNERVFVGGSLMTTGGDLLNALVVLTVNSFNSGQLATIINKRFDFLDGVVNTPADILGSAPEWDPTVSEEGLSISCTISHADLPAGSLTFPYGFAVAQISPADVTHSVFAADGAGAQVDSVQVGDTARLIGSWTPLTSGDSGHLTVTFKQANNPPQTIADDDFSFAKGHALTFDAIHSDVLAVQTGQIDNAGETYFDWAITADGYADITGRCYLAVTDFPAETDVVLTAPAYQFGTAHGAIDLTSLLGAAQAAGYDLGYAAAQALYPAWEAIRNISAGAANIIVGAWELIANVRINGTNPGGGGTPPDAPTWGGQLVPGDGQITVPVVAAAAGDTIQVRYRLAPDGEPVVNQAFQRTGTGNIVLTGLTNFTLYGVDFYAVTSGLTSLPAKERFRSPTDGSLAVIEQVMDSVRDQVNLMALASLTDAGASVAVAAEVQVPPDFQQVDTPIIKVFPDTETAEPTHNVLNEIRYRVSVAFCQRSKSAGQQSEQMLVREALRDQFLGKRLAVLPEMYCERETESGVVDLDALWERFQWVSVTTFEFVALRAQG